MAIKDIFLPLVSYPTPTTVAAIEKGVAIAGYLGADISATAVELEVPAPAGPSDLAAGAGPAGVRSRREILASGTHPSHRTMFRGGYGGSAGEPIATQ